MDLTVSIHWPNIPDNADELYAIEAYKAVDNFYSGNTLTEVKKGLTQQGNTISVNGFLATKMFVGQEPFSLKKALTTSNRTKVSQLTGEKQLTVPIKGKLVKMTENSKGWIHPGFTSDYFNAFVEYIQSAEMESLMVDIFTQ